MARKARAVGESDPSSEYMRVEIEGQPFDALREPHVDAPARRPYVFRADLLRDMRVAVTERINTMLTGPTGCGKTSLPLALAAELGYPVLRINLNGETRVTHLVGLQKPAAEDGVLTLKFSPGVLAKAMREGYWLILDEIDAATSSVLMTLQPVLEDRPSLYIPETGEHISHGHGLHPRFHVFATGNTIGYRSFTRARHAGTTPLNTALLDRFGMVIAVDYSDRASEFAVVRCNVPDCTPDFIEGICRVAEEIRIDSNFKADFSTRRLIQWARLLPLYDYDVLRASELAIARKLETATDAKVFREIARRVFGYENEG